MTVPTQPVSGKLADFGGASVAGVIVTAKLSDVDYTADGTFVGTEPVTTVTDAGGNFVLNVFPNAVAPTGLGTRGTVLTITARPPNSKAIRVEAVIPNAPCNLVDHLVREEQNGLTGSERAAFDAQAARDLAKDWATKTSGEVVAGQGFGAKKYAQDASADAQQTSLDRQQTGQDRIATGQDRQQTGLDAIQTGQDRVATDTDRVAVAADRLAAEAARDSVNSTGKVFSDTTAGIAGTTSGQTFAVLDASLQFWIVYKNNAGAAEEVARNYTKAYLDGVVNPTEYDVSTVLVQWLDSAQRVLMYIRNDATLIAKLGVSLGAGGNGLTWVRQADGTYVLSLGATDGVLPIGSAGAANITADAFSEEVLAQQIDANGRSLWRVLFDGSFVAKFKSDELDAARGSVGSIATRMAPTLRADGLPNTPVYGEWNLRETRRINAAMRAGEANAQLVICAFGDSWSDNAPFWITNFTRSMKARYGNAGAGFVGVQRGCADPLEATESRTGTWAANDFTEASPHIRSISSSTVGARWTVSALVGAAAVELLHEGGAGTVQYRYNGGAWVPLNLTGAGTVSKTLVAPPAGAFTLDVEVTSGVVKLYGADLRNTINGVRVHKCGASSTKLPQWNAIDATAWQQGVAILAPSLCISLFGTNDAYGSSPADFAAGWSTHVDRIRAARPGIDVLLVSSPLNLLNDSFWSLADLAYAGRALVPTRQVAHVDLQPFFGVSTAEYGDAGRAYMLAADPVHPSQPKGADVVASAIFLPVKD